MNERKRVVSYLSIPVGVGVIHFNQKHQTSGTYIFFFLNLICSMLCKVLRMRSPLRNSLYPQMVKNLPAEWETWVGSLGWEDPLEEGMAAHSGILAWRIRTDREAWLATIHGVAQSAMTQRLNTAKAVRTR